MNLNPQPIPPFPLEARRLRDLPILTLTFALALLCVVFMVFGLFVAACTPSQVKAIETDAIPAMRATCVIARAVTTDGTVHELCATADELAPFVESMIEARTAESAPDASTLALAAALEAPKRRVPARRHCAVWTSTGGAPDGGRSEGEDRRTTAGRDAGASTSPRGAPSVDGSDERIHGGDASAQR